MKSSNNNSCSVCGDSNHSNQPPSQSNQSSRRAFLQTSALTVSTVTLAEVFGANAAAQSAGQAVQHATYPRIKIATLADITPDKPIAFTYPEEVLHGDCMLVQLNRPAGGGVGPKSDIVAFSTRCTHMGGDMSSGYVSEHKLLGCGEHLTTFDLTRHGMVVAGHATTSLPQIVLEIESDEIFATGIVGLIYGHHQNPTGQSS